MTDYRKAVRETRAMHNINLVRTVLEKVRAIVDEHAEIVAQTLSAPSITKYLRRRTLEEEYLEKINSALCALNSIKTVDFFTSTDDVREMCGSCYGIGIGQHFYSEYSSAEELQLHFELSVCLLKFLPKVMESSQEFSKIFKLSEAYRYLKDVAYKLNDIVDILDRHGVIVSD